MKSKARISVAVATAAGMSLVLAACAGQAPGDAGATSAATTSTPSPSLNLTIGGTFATQTPAPGGAIGEDQALEAARQTLAALQQQGGVAAAKAQATATAASSWVSVQPYSTFTAQLDNTSASQLDPKASVIEVTLDASVPAAALPAAAGTTRTEGWTAFSAAYDARTGLTLWEGPTPIAKSADASN